MLKRLLLTTALVLAVGGIGLAAINNIVGANVSGPKPTLPLSAVVLCQAPDFCTRVMAPDWSNTDIWYGSDGSVCRKSIDGADTWADCDAQPSATAVYNQYAVTRNGTVLAGANDGGGAVFRISRSTDGAASWTNVYSSAPVDLLNSTITNGRFRCAESQDLCTFFGRDGANNIWSLTSVDDGVTWALDTTIASPNITQYFMTAFANDGLLGYAFGGIGDGFSQYRSINWNGTEWTQASTIFTPSTAGGICNFAFILNGDLRSICHVTTLGTSWTMQDPNGTVLSTFTIPDVLTGQSAQIGLGISMSATSIYLFYLDSTSRTGIWVSNDSGTSFTKIFATDGGGSAISTQGSIYSVNGCVYASYLVSAFTSTVVRIC